VCRKANIDLTKRAGELSEEEVKLQTITHCLMKVDMMVLMTVSNDSFKSKLIRL